MVIVCALSEFEGLRSQKLEERWVFIEKYVFLRSTKSRNLLLSPSRSDLVVQSFYFLKKIALGEIYNLSMVSGPVFKQIKNTNVGVGGRGGFFWHFSKQKKENNGMNEVGFRFHELSLGQNVPLDCGNSLGLFLAKNSRKTGGKSRFFLLSSSLLPASSHTNGSRPYVWYFPKK